MALPVVIPNTFANATASIPLSQLDTNFTTLSNAVNGISNGSETLANLAATTVTVTNNISAAKFVPTGNVTAGNGMYLPAANTVAFSTNGAEAMRIDSSGNLLVGTTTSQGAKFAADGGAGSAIWGKCSTVSAAVNITWNSATSGDNLFEQFFVGTGPSLVGSIDYNRTGGLTRYNTTSDATLKNIIGDSNGQKSVEILNSTRIREFAWKDDETQKPQIGVIAQELYETYKGAVSVGGDYEVTISAVTEQRLVSEAVLDEDSNEIEAAVYETVEIEPERTETKYRPWAVDKTAFTFHLVAGWQAHEKIIKQQADMIAALEARIAALEQE